MLTRAQVLERYQQCRYTYRDWSIRPLEQGMGGCPWRIALAVLLRTNAAQDVAAKLLAALLVKWRTPADLASADRWELRQLLSPLNAGSRRARVMQQLAQTWLTERWQTYLDLPGVGQAALDTVEQYDGATQPKRGGD